MSDYNLHYTSYPENRNNIVSSEETFLVLRFSTLFSFIHAVTGVLLWNSQQQSKCEFLFPLADVLFICSYLLMLSASLIIKYTMTEWQQEAIVA